MRVADYMLPPRGFPTQGFYYQGRDLKTQIEFIYDRADLVRLRQTNPDGTWLCDWLLRIELDGSITEYGDTYPKTSSFLDNLDFWRKNKVIMFQPGWELRWVEHIKTQCRVDYLRSSPSKWSTGTYSCFATQVDQDTIEILSIQTFGRTDTAKYRCVRGRGIVALMYLQPDGSYVTLEPKATVA